jgi:PBP1b-binding outer membrane lipoprotein LpoB
MYRVLLVLLLALLAAGCNQSAPAAVNTSDTSQTQQNLFSQKERCATYLPDIQQRLSSETKAHATLDKLFYSPSRNSCVHVENRALQADNGKTFSTLILLWTLTYGTYMDNLV